MRTLAGCFGMLLGVTAAAHAQRGRVEVDTVRSASLANRVGDPSWTRVTIYLPPSYDRAPPRRYPVVYLLHGFTGNDAAWVSTRNNVPGLMDSLIAAGASAEMIVVMPNAYNRFAGSFYVNSTTNGNWDDFISGDLVRFVDGRFRTIANAASRGIAGHSMGGYGAFYLGMRHGGTVYGAIYGLSACCSRAGATPDQLPVAAVHWDSIAAFTSFEQLDHSSFLTRYLAAAGAAFSPDPSRPPFFLDPEVVRRYGTPVVDTAVLARWDAHSTLLMVPRYAATLRRLRGIAFDIGDHDQAVPPAEMFAMDSAMRRAGVPHTFETYDGDHVSKIHDRLVQRVMPFFTRVLARGP